MLRLLQKSYYGKVKMIYIDPPYNTGNDSFVYPDNYSETLDEYQRRTGEKNEAGFLNKQSLWKKNSKESGQYHSAWLSMMYPRLYLARNLLRDDGVIFISIDDNEAANLKVLCDEVFGAENFVADFIWQHRKSSQNDVDVSLSHNHTLCFSKKRDFFRLNPLGIDSGKFDNPDSDSRGPWVADPFDAPNIRPNLTYQITNPSTGAKHLPPNGRCWRFSQEKFAQALSDQRIVFGKSGKGRPQYKRFQSEAEDKGTNPFTVWTDTGTATEGTKELMKLFKGQKIFDTPKPVRLINEILKLSVDEDSIVLDFFAGSGTTAHAVMELNLEDGGNRQSISVQMPEVLDEDSEAYKSGYRTIADITRARIDKVIAKLKAEHPEKTADLACAHFTLAPSNFKVWRGDANTPEALREQLALFQTAEKMDSRIRWNESGNGDAAAGDREDAATKVGAQNAMLAELLLKHGLGALGVHAISKPKKVAGVTVHRVLLPNDNGNDKTLWLCFDTYNSALKDEIVQAKPAQVVMLNSCFTGPKADELLSNLQLELAGLEIGLTVI